MTKKGMGKRQQLAKKYRERSNLETSRSWYVKELNGLVMTHKTQEEIKENIKEVDIALGKVISEIKELRL